MRVVLPAPLGPRSAKTVPGSTESDTSSNAWFEPKRFDTPLTLDGHHCGLREVISVRYIWAAHAAVHRSRDDHFLAFLVSHATGYPSAFA